MSRVYLTSPLDRESRLALQLPTLYADTRHHPSVKKHRSRCRAPAAFEVRDASPHEREKIQVLIQRLKSRAAKDDVTVDETAKNATNVQSGQSQYQQDLKRIGGEQEGDEDE